MFNRFEFPDEKYLMEKYMWDVARQPGIFRTNPTKLQRGLLLGNGEFDFNSFMIHFVERGLRLKTRYKCIHFALC
jgi:hypothetical protein